MQAAAQKREALPDWLSRFSDSDVSSACSDLVGPQVFNSSFLVD